MRTISGFSYSHRPNWQKKSNSRQIWLFMKRYMADPKHKTAMELDEIFKSQEVMDAQEIPGNVRYS